MPTIEQLIEYLTEHDFKADQQIVILAGDLRERKIYKVENLIGITDQHHPVLILELGEPKPMDEEVAADNDDVRRM